MLIAMILKSRQIILTTMIMVLVILIMILMVLLMINRRTSGGWNKRTPQRYEHDVMPVTHGGLEQTNPPNTYLQNENRYSGGLETPAALT